MPIADAHTWRDLNFQADVKRRLLALPELERLKLGIKRGVPGLSIPFDAEPMPTEDWVMPMLLSLRDTPSQQGLKVLEQEIYDIEERLGMRWGGL